jgi:hypothetical protein
VLIRAMKTPLYEPTGALGPAIRLNVVPAPLHHRLTPFGFQCTRKKTALLKTVVRHV